jgi:hypothetical protein
LIPYIGDFVANSTVRYFFGTNTSTGASVNRTTAGVIRVYKGTSVTERTSVVGITDTSGFDSVTGLNSLSIDLSNNTDAGFYAVGNDYVVVLVGAVIDTQTVNVPLFQFSIENRFSSISNAVWNTLESSITTASTIGLKVKTNLNDTITSRMATFTYTAPPTAQNVWEYATRTLTSGAAPSATTIADAVLNRKLDSTGDGTDTLNERTVRSALRAMRNKVVVASGVMTVSKEDDTATAWSATLSNTANVTVDPT